jgi:uncharacterized protein (TIGR02217 family)
MSAVVLPSLPGLGWDIVRTPVWSTNVQSAISGKECRISYWSYPKWKWELTFNILRSSSAYTEFQQLVGFFNARQGQFDTFLFSDPDDNSVTGQTIGTGDGSTKTFQLVRAFGGFVEPVLAPNVVSHVYNNGTDSGGWSVSNWGTSSPGVITYVTAPAAGHAITADFSYYWPVRMDADTLAFNLFMTQFYACKKYSFTSVKN